jgi:hypothetical protein
MSLRSRHSLFTRTLPLPLTLTTILRHRELPSFSRFTFYHVPYTKTPTTMQYIPTCVILIHFYLKIVLILFLEDVHPGKKNYYFNKSSCRRECELKWEVFIVEGYHRRFIETYPTNPSMTYNHDHAFNIFIFLEGLL